MSDYEGTIDIKGIHGTYEFHYCPLDSTFTKFGAVYVISHFDKIKNSHAIFYVGETCDMSKRFYDHHKQQCFDNTNADYICVYPEEDKKVRLNIQDDINNHWKPPCND